MDDLTVIIPTLNEEESIRLTITKVLLILEKSRINGQILVVDDNSTDSTITILKDIKSANTNVDFIVREKDHGLSQSLVDGFKTAKTDILLVTDADGQHQLDKIPELYHTILEGNDIAIGSRYMGISGSGVKDWAFHRRVLSWGATYLARFLFPKITDSGSGFFAIRKEVIKDAPLKPQGFRMLFEILGKGHWKTAKEIPYMFGVRENGSSKLKFKTILMYLSQLWGLFSFSLTHTDSHGYAEIKRLITFIGVGVSGIVVNLATLYALTEWMGMWYVGSSILAIEASILWNFSLHERYTFKDIENKKHDHGQRLMGYHITSVFGSIISLTTLIILTEYLGIWYIAAAALGIMIAFIFNFTTNKVIIWEGEV